MFKINIRDTLILLQGLNSLSSVTKLLYIYTKILPLFTNKYPLQGYFFFYFNSVGEFIQNPVEKIFFYPLNQ